MLRPERMSRVSVTGSKRVMDDVIETVHDLNLLHVTEYGEEWDGFEPGDPLPGADDAAQKLVTVRALESTLEVTDEDAGPGAQIITDEALEEQLDEVREAVNDADDRRSEIRNELRQVEDRIETMEPFVRLGIDLDLLRDYEHLTVVVGEGDPEGVRETLADSEIADYEVFDNEGVVAVAARADAGDLQDALVNAAFTGIEVPDGEGDPEEYLSELRHRKQQLEAKLGTVEDELENLRLDYGGFLLAAEEQLTIQVDKLEAPLAFATTANAFVAEGWIPTDRYDELEGALREAVGDHVEVSELERASYDEDGHVEDHEAVAGGAGGAAAAGADDGDADAAAAPTAGADEADEEVAADGGSVVTMGEESPPVVQDNPGAAKPFEALTEVINRPKYTELDPTFVFFLTFPAFFGFMIGDLGYGVLYMAIGYWIVKNFDSDVVQSLGGVALWAGGFTAVFGILYGEFFGLHQLGEIVWGGNPPIHKGLQPHFVYYAYAWLLVSVIVGVLHLVVGRAFDFVNNLDHGFREAFMESGSWIILTLGVWFWVFSRSAMGPKPNFMWSVFAGKGMTNPATGEAIQNVALPLGFTGFPVIDLVGPISLQAAIILVGLALVIAAEGPIGIVESITQAFGHVVSYTRIAAVLLAKAGMALVVNLLVFGATLHNGEFHFIFFMSEAPNPEEVVFAGLVNGEGAAALALGWIGGILILVVGHLLVLVLGITSAGLQAVRLEYVEFFGKFYEGGGTAYLPFGQEREYTSD
jgi:V/A-type H+-transporting ATPase subunit I